jgi:hypothetical protein
MAKKTKKTELEDDLNLVMMMWDEGTFSSMIRNGNAEVARFADTYWEALAAAGQKDSLTKTQFFKELTKMPELNAEDRCRVALNTVIRLRENSFRAVGTRADISSMIERLYREGADQKLRQACLYALDENVYGCATLAAQYGPKELLACRRILSAWMVQK